ncbi:MAG: cation transporter [Planctomycetes bacterium]|nr:cation transporter [Planctomycetota bacterium]
MTDALAAKHRALAELYRQSRRAAVGGAVVTLALGVAKAIGGWAGHSLALLSDSVHSFGDSLASLSILGALVWAQRPADREHPYGHMRIEAISALVVALLLLCSGVWLLVEACHHWNVDRPEPHGYGVVIAAASVLLNEGLFRYSRRVARATGSQAVLAAAWDQRLDAFGSLIVLWGLCLTKWGGPGLAHADGLAVFVVVAIIFWAAGHLGWESLQELMDRQADETLLAQIRHAASAVPGVRAIEKLHVRKSGLEHLVDIHVQVDPQISVKEGHSIGHRVKETLVTDIVTIRDVLVHIEPSGG